MSETTLAIATSLKPGRYVIFDGKACVVRSVQISKPGKHGHAKCRVEAITVIGDQKIIKVIPGHDNVEVPIIEKETAQVMSINADIATVMDMKTYETFELPIPEELKKEIKEGSQVLYWTMMGQKVMKQVK